MDGIIILVGILCFQDAHPDVSRTLAAAYYSHSQAETYVNNQLHYIDQQFSHELKTNVGTAVFITKTVIDQKVSFTWTFP